MKRKGLMLSHETLMHNGDIKKKKKLINKPGKKEERKTGRIQGSGSKRRDSFLK